MPKKTITTTVAKKTTKKVVKKVTSKKAPKKPAPKKIVKTIPPLVVPVAHPSAPVIPPPVKTEAQKIWDEIKDRPIEMFGLPGQVVAMHAVPVTVEPTKLYLVTRSTATLPSLEAAIGDKYTVELADKFVIVARNTKLPFIVKK
jgi:hypothetical protein